MYLHKWELLDGPILCKNTAMSQWGCSQAGGLPLHTLSPEPGEDPTGESFGSSLFNTSTTYLLRYLSESASRFPSLYFPVWCKNGSTTYGGAGGIGE